MYRFKIKIEYDGSRFSGWQRQEKAIVTVQGQIEKGLKSFCGYDVLVEGAGRTDSGVHALGQVAHFDLKQSYELYRIQDALNFYLSKHGVSILSVETVDSDFHSRFSARMRTYQYRIINRRPPLMIEKLRAWHVVRPLCTQSMNEAAQVLVGRHDFNSFRSSACQALSSIRTLELFEVVRRDELIVTTIRSRSFLHNQVRVMMGTLQKVGDGKLTKDDVVDILQSADRTRAGQTAPAHGLYLSSVEYN
jgi:tRNA pseudouridine38-40 synthase